MLVGKQLTGTTPAMSESLFQELLIILSFSLAGVLLLQRLRVASIVAYMAVGAIIGPGMLGLIAEPAQFAFLAEFGVVFLLFALGLEFSLKKMLTMRYAVFGVGGIQVLVCSLIFFAAVYSWGASVSSSLLIAGSLALSSTAIVTRELSNNRQLHNLHGQLSVGVLLFQDLVAIVFLVLVPVLAGNGEQSLIASLAQAAGSALVVFVVLLTAGRWLLPVVFREVAKSNSDEIFLLTTLVIVLFAAWFAHALHLSMPLGAFLIGMMLGEGSWKYQIESDIRPFKDILLGLFFVTIGMNVDLGLLLEHGPRLLLFTLALLAIKSLIVAAVVRGLGYSSQNAAAVGVNLAQAGEFGLALMTLAVAAGLVPIDQASFVILIAIFTMMLSPVLIRRSQQISRLLFNNGTTGKQLPSINLEMQNHVLIGGFGRLGRVLADFLEHNGIPYIATEVDIDRVDQARKEGRNIVFGDSNNVEILRHCHLDTARLVVLTFKSLEEGKAAIARIRERNLDIPIIVRCQDHRHYEELISLGASEVIPEVLESSLLITRQVLTMLAVDHSTIEEQLSNFQRRSTRIDKPGD